MQPKAHKYYSPKNMDREAFEQRVAKSFNIGILLRAEKVTMYVLKR